MTSPLCYYNQIITSLFCLFVDYLKKFLQYTDSYEIVDFDLPCITIDYHSIYHFFLSLQGFCCLFVYSCF